MGMDAFRIHSTTHCIVCPLLGDWCIPHNEGSGGLGCWVDDPIVGPGDGEMKEMAPSLREFMVKGRICAVEDTAQHGGESGKTLEN
jgi:hypothetical protein